MSEINDFDNTLRRCFDARYNCCVRNAIYWMHMTGVPKSYVEDVADALRRFEPCHPQFGTELLSAEWPKQQTIVKYLDGIRAAFGAPIKVYSWPATKRGLNAVAIANHVENALTQFAPAANRYAYFLFYFFFEYLKQMKNIKVLVAACLRAREAMPTNRTPQTSNASRKRQRNKSRHLSGSST